MAISKSTPYVRYKENFTSNLHLGTIHVESEYLDRTQKTTIESIHGMTWHNKVVNENKELDLLSNLGFELTESKKEYFNVGEQRVSVDEIHGMQDIEPNEDGTYTYSVTSIEGEYAEIYDGLNHITSTSDGLDGNFEIVYDTDEEDITGSVVLDATMPNYTIEDSNVGELNDVVFKGETLVNILPQPSLRNKMENTSMQRLNEGHDEVVVADGEYKSAILKGQTLVNIIPEVVTPIISASDNSWYQLTESSPNNIVLTVAGEYPTSWKYIRFECFSDVSTLDRIKPNTKYLIKFDELQNIESVSIRTGAGTNMVAPATKVIGNYAIVTTKNTWEVIKGILLFLTPSDGLQLNDRIICRNPIMVEYQEGMENWDIPYFEGMQSVRMPVLTTVGKNLIPSPLIANTGLTWVDGTEYSTGSDYQFTSTEFIKIQTGVYYTSSSNVDNILKRVHCYDKNKMHLGTLKIDGSIAKDSSDINIANTFKIDNENVRYIRLTFYGVVEIPQLEQGSTSTAYEPYKSNNISVVSSTVKELDQSQFEQGTLAESSAFGLVYDNTKSDIGYTDIRIRSKIAINTAQVNEIQGSIQGDYQVFLLYYENNKYMKQYSGWLFPYQGKFSNTLPKGCTEIGIVIKKSDNSSISVAEVDSMNLTLTMLTDTTLRGIGDVKDELNLLTGELTQRVGGVVLDGSDDENWEQSQPDVNEDVICDRFMIKIPNLRQNPYTALLGNVPTYTDSNEIGYNVNKIGIKTHTLGGFYLYIPKIIYGGKVGEVPNVGKLKTYLQSNPIIVQYELATPTTKTIDLTVTDQDNVVLETGKPRSYKDGHIQVQSLGILPSSISYEVPSQNHMYVDMLKPSNTYTLKRNGENFEGSFFIDGEEYNTSVFMTSHQLPNKSLIINDMGEHDKVAMFEGNYGTSTIPYFEGMASVKMPVLKTTNGKNLFNINGNFDTAYTTYSVTGDALTVTGMWYVRQIVNLKADTVYTLSYERVESNNGYRQIAVYFNGVESYLANTDNNILTFTTPHIFNDISVLFYTGTGTENTATYYNIQLEEGSEPHKSNTLTINEPIQLRAIGDVKDEYNVETGELTQRIGEIVLDGSEDWSYGSGNSTSAVALFYTKLDNNTTYKKSINDRLPSIGGYTASFGEGIYLDGDINIRINTNRLSNISVEFFKQYLQSNPITVQYQLAEPTTRKVISTILDQDGRQIHSMHTYTGLTNLSTSSDTLIPNVNLDYEISSSTGTVTGTSATIENGENGSPISAIVYGESLVNSIQESSDTEYVVLGEHSGNNITIENSVEGNIKSAVIKGNTLVNLISGGREFTIQGGANKGFALTYSQTTAYTLLFKVNKNNSSNKLLMQEYNGESWLRNVQIDLVSGENKAVITPTNSVTQIVFVNSATDELVIGDMMLLNGNHNNHDIPYFEGMQSVEMPTLTTTGKNLIDVSHTLSLTREQNPTVNSQDASRTEFTDVALNSFTSTTASSGYWQYACYRVSNVKPNTTYTLSYLKNIINPPEEGSSRTHRLMMFTPEKGSTSSSSSNGRSVYTITTENDGVLFLCLADESKNGGGVGAKTQFSDIQLEEGSTTTSYEPYQSNTLTINEPIELCAIGDVKDELDLVTGSLTKRVDEVNVKDAPQIGTSVGNDTIRFGFKYSFAASNQVISNYPVKQNIDWQEENIGVENGTNDVSIRIPKSELADESYASALKFIEDNNIKIYGIMKEPITRTIDLTVTDQDGNPTSLHSYNDTTHIITNSQGLIANVEISNPSYDVVLKANTKYTLKLNRTNAPTNTPLEINLGGTEATMDSTVNSITITTPSTLANNKLTMSGVGNKFKEAMVIEGDCVNRDLDFFEGIVGVENPILITIGKNLFDGELKVGGLTSNGKVDDSFSNRIVSYNFIPIKNNIQYKLSSVDNLSLSRICFYDNNKQFISQSYTTDFISPTNAKYLRFAFTNTENIESQIMLEEGSTASTYEPHKSNTLTTYPQITLHSIGGIKDELDLVNETVTRRIGEIVLNGSEDWKTGGWSNQTKSIGFETIIKNDVGTSAFIKAISDKLLYDSFSNFQNDGEYFDMVDAGNECLRIRILRSKLSTEDVKGFKQWLSQNPITVQYELATPITESVYITPPNPQTSTASVTLSTQLGESDFVTWNPYKEHYVHYNYEQDGSYTWENLTDLNERQFIELYDRRTYVEQEYKNTFLSHDSKGTSKYVLIEPNQDYTVTVRFSELSQCETVKINLGGSEVEMNVSDPRVHVTTPNTLSNYLCSISGEGLSGKITDILVIHCLEHEGFADIDYFEGIDSIGEVVDGKASIIVEQTNGNLLDFEPTLFSNGNYISMAWNENPWSIPLKPRTSYVLKVNKPKQVTSVGGWGETSPRLFDKDKVQTRAVNFPLGDATLFKTEFTTTDNERYLRFYSQQSQDGDANIHLPMQLSYATESNMTDYIKPRYYDKEEIILPMQLCRINTVYDNFYYDVIRGHYRIQQSIGHKYFTGADNENWTMIGNEERILRFRYNNADIQIKSLGEYMTNRFTNGTATSPYESCAFNGSTFIISIDKERLSSATLTAFKEWLSSHNVHLYYQLATPMMIDLPQYSSKLELNTYKDEIYTFLKNCKPTVFTLDVPLDQTYRFYELQESQGYTNRIELTDERMTEEDALYINTIYGSGISNLIEEPNNVNTLLKPNYEGRATSHTLTNGKVSTISVHGFEPNSARVGTYNTVTKQYELTVKATSGENNNSVAFPIPYALEQYEDGTHDRVYYNSEYKQWMFEGKQTLTVAYNSSTGVFTNAIEVFRGMMPRSGMIGEFKVKFASGTTSARLYYSLDGSTYTYTTLRSMTDGVEYYIAFFNTGGTKIDMGTKIGADSEYVTLVPLSGTVPEALMINQIQSITECTYYLDKTYYYTEPTRPIELTVYEGTNTITENNGAIITIENNAHNKDALIYANTPYTVYWTYVGGEGNIKVTLGGATQEVVATQGYVTITTSDADLERGLFIGGFDVTIKDLMLVKGERIADLSYFEGSRAVGTAFIDEDGNTMYRITLVTGSELIQDKFEDVITFEDNKKHNVLVTKLLGTKPNKN